MFVNENFADELAEAASKLQDLLTISADSNPTPSDLKCIVNIQQKVNASCERIISKYSNSGQWATEGYLSGKTAVVHETGLSKRSVELSIARGNLLQKYPEIQIAVDADSITTDHITSFLPLLSETYAEFFNDDSSLLVETAKTLSALQFSNVVRHWKNMVDAVINQPSDEYVAFSERKLFLSEVMDGKYIIHGELDPIAGKLLEKALKDISQKLWNSTSAELRASYSPSQQRADALGYLAQGHNIDNISSAPLTADITIGLNDLDPKTTTHEFLSELVESNSPIVSTRSKKYLEQVLCDSEIQVPIKIEGVYDFGRKARTAPTKLKKQLLISQDTCTIEGCITPAKWCDAHHIHHWVDGGQTNLENLALLCRRHHTMIHNDKTFAKKVSGTLKTNSPPISNSS